ncbi:MFS transporter [Ferrimicrobium acidiphilum]|uniref:MFS transporter n=1 Tax=Ferrimicrobium acidiphilum TaxID=121039 RepID=UPI0023F1B05B|nr:MFS transporter [Ferrimicrobium acidiphilum]
MSDSQAAGTGRTLLIGDLLTKDLAVSVLATSMASIPAFLVGALAVEIRQSFPITTSELGLAVTSYYLGAASWAVPSGRVAERLGGVRVLKFTPVVGSILLATIALFSSSWWLLALLLFPCGMVSAATATASNLFLARRGKPGRQGATFGIKQAAVPFASLLGGLAVPALGLTVGWRWAFALAALLSIATAILVPRPNQPRSKLSRQHVGAPPVIDKLAITLLAIGIGLGVFSASGMAAFLVSGSVHAGISKSAAGLVAALAGAATVIVRITTGFLADRRGSSHFSVIAIMMVIGAIGYATLALAQHLGIAALLVPGAVVALGIGWGWNGLFNFAVIDKHRATPARATGMTQLGGRLGGMLGPTVIGVLIDRFSYSTGWIAAAATCAMAAVAVVLGSRLLERKTT